MAEDLKQWNPEDETEWETRDKAIANRNLWISIPALLCGFAVWLYWGIITVQMINLGYPFEKSQLFTLAAIAGLTGATLRIPSTFFIRLAGGRNTIFFHHRTVDPARSGYRVFIAKPRYPPYGSSN
ncbi:MAG: hypothetical protein Q9M45_09735 [Robiginitomaculum sp.]|nr:hypothetical protein [Robiginitomaculum sp.]